MCGSWSATSHCQPCRSTRCGGGCREPCSSHFCHNQQPAEPQTVRHCWLPLTRLGKSSWCCTLTQLCPPACLAGGARFLLLQALGAAPGSHPGVPPPGLPPAHTQGGGQAREGGGQDSRARCCCCCWRSQAGKAGTNADSTHACRPARSCSSTFDVCVEWPPCAGEFRVPAGGQPHLLHKRRGGLGARC